MTLKFHKKTTRDLWFTLLFNYITKAICAKRLNSIRNNIAIFIFFENNWSNILFGNTTPNNKLVVGADFKGKIWACKYIAGTIVIILLLSVPLFRIRQALHDLNIVILSPLYRIQTMLYQSTIDKTIRFLFNVSSRSRFFKTELWGYFSLKF